MRGCSESSTRRSRPTAPLRASTPTDLAGTLHDMREEIRKLPQLHDQLWDLFKPVRNKKDMEQFEQFLADEAIAAGIL